jgi:hypothetical protein
MTSYVPIFTNSDINLSTGSINVSSGNINVSSGNINLSGTSSININGNGMINAKNWYFNSIYNSSSDTSLPPNSYGLGSTLFGWKCLPASVTNTFQSGVLFFNSSSNNFTSFKNVSASTLLLNISFSLALNNSTPCTFLWRYDTDTTFTRILCQGNCSNVAGGPGFSALSSSFIAPLNANQSLMMHLGIPSTSFATVTANELRLAIYCIAVY